MLQFFLHMIGDYVTQNDWMATAKTKNSKEGYLACLIHSVLYSLPFLIIGSWKAVLVTTQDLVLNPSYFYKGGTKTFKNKMLMYSKFKSEKQQPDVRP